MNKDTITQEDIKKIANSIGDDFLEFENKTILITGGSGFLGKYIVGTLLYLNDKLLEKPCRIINIDNHITSYRSGDLEKQNYIRYINNDVTKPIKIKENIDFIIHAAGIASPIYYQKYPLETINVAVNGTKNMLDMAREKRIKSFLYFSSSEIYGNPPKDEIPTKEGYNGNVSSIGPRACYDESKRLGETLCVTYYRLFNVPVKIVRPFNIFGPGMRSDDYRVIPRFIFNAFNGIPIPVHSEGKQTRTFCYISDGVTGFFMALIRGKSGEAYNVGNDRNEISMNELAEIFESLFRSKLKIENIDYPKGYPSDESLRRCPELSKVNNLGYRPSMDLIDGLQRTIDWCEKNWKIK